MKTVFSDLKNKQIQNKQDQIIQSYKPYEKSYSNVATCSNSIQNLLGDYEDKLFRKLKSQNFNQIQPMTLKSKGLEKLIFLTKQEKIKLRNKLQFYRLKQSDPFSYSKQLLKYFISKKKQAILQKMQQNKVKQTRLLKLTHIQINQLSFLEPEQKISLQKLIKEYLNQKQFNELRTQIELENKLE